MDATVATRTVQTPRQSVRRRTLLGDWRREWVTLALVLPGFAYFLVFYYIPLLGYVIAFENYLPFLGFFASPWVGFENFGSLFGDRNFWAAVQNTLLFAFLQLALFFPAPIGLALLLNSVLSGRVRRFVQPSAARAARTRTTSACPQSSSSFLRWQHSGRSRWRGSEYYPQPASIHPLSTPRPV